MNRYFNLLALYALTLAPVSFAQDFRAHPVTLEGTITSQTPPAVITAKVPIFAVYTVTVQEQRTCTQVICQEIPGDGTKGDWKGFYTAPRNERAERLASAIKGIGIKSAEKMIEVGNFFTSKPRTWTAFTREILSAESTLIARGFKGRFADSVISIYGVENAKNLGYYETNSCTEQTFPCAVWVEKEVEQFMYNLERQVRVVVTNASLQDFESEKYRITVGMQPQAIRVEKPGTYNNYDASVMLLSNTLSQVNLNAISRIRVALPFEAGSAALYKTSEGVKISVSTNPLYLPKANDAASELKILYRVCQIDWFGGCYKTMVPWTTETLRETNKEISIPGRHLKAGSKHKVWYKFVRTGSRFYNDEGYTRTTETVKVK